MTEYLFRGPRIVDKLRRNANNEAVDRIIALDIESGNSEDFSFTV